MEISWGNKFVFVHVGKCAGESISHALRPWASDGPWRLDNRQWKHATARRIRNVLLLPDHRWSDFFSFAVLRPPWEWLHSLYHYKRQMAQHLADKQADPELAVYRHQVQRFAEWTFAEWIGFACAHYGQQGGMLRRWCCDAAGRRIVRCIVRHERLAEEWPAIARACGLPEGVELPHRNATVMPDGSPRPHYADEFSDGLRRQVARAFYADIEAMGWRFGEG